jgi:hypothetical protein
MKQMYKIFMVDNKPYITIDENVVIGDKAIVTVGDQFPTLVECQNDEQINLFQKPKTSLTKRHKIVNESHGLQLTDEIVEYVKNKNGVTIVEVIDGVANILEDE